MTPKTLIRILCLTIGLAVLPALKVTAATFVVYGASGRIGDFIVNEALSRGHNVIGVSRNPADSTNDHPNFAAIPGDATDLNSVLEIIPGVDAVIVSVSGVGPGNTPEEATTLRAATTFIQAANQLGESAPRIVQVGGGTTLWVDGVLGLDTLAVEEGTPRHGQYHGHWLALNAYKASTDVKWTVMTPPPGIMEAGERTGEYRLGEDDVLLNAEGEMAISTRDLAVAIVDEAESGQSVGKRVAVGPQY